MWKNGDRDGAARDYRRALGFGTDAAALAREWPTSVFATHPATGGPGQVPVSLLLSARLSSARSNLAVLEGTSSTPDRGDFARVSAVAASDAGLADSLQRLSVATGPVSGAVCDACNTARPPDAKLKICDRCYLASCVFWRRRTLPQRSFCFFLCSTTCRYCNVECQQRHWPLHSTVCCVSGTFLPGDTVTLNGLQQRADLNGRVARVECHVSGEGETARWRVHLDVECVSVKAANLSRHPRKPST
jgi:hypothetical protein